MGVQLQHTFCEGSAHVLELLGSERAGGEREHLLGFALELAAQLGEPQQTFALLRHRTQVLQRLVRLHRQAAQHLPLALALRVQLHLQALELRRHVVALLLQQPVPLLRLRRVLADFGCTRERFESYSI